MRPHIGVVLLLLVAAPGCGRKAVEPPPAEVGNTQRHDIGPPSPPKDPGTRAKPHHFNRVVALCVGIDKYRSPRVEKIAHCGRDAAEFARVLREQYGFETVTLLDEQATRAGVLERVAHLRDELKEGDALIVYFACHGQVVDLPSFGQEGYLVPHDADVNLTDTRNRESWAAQCIEMRELAKNVSASRAQHVLFVVDTCCSGFMTKRGAATMKPGAADRLSRRSRTVIAATTQTQSAYSDHKTGHGRFTGEIIQALDGRKDPLGLTELFEKVHDAMVAGTGDNDTKMIPVRRDLGDDTGEFVFLPLSFASDKVTAALKAYGIKLSERLSRRTTLDEFLAVFDAADYRYSPKRLVLEDMWRKRYDRFRENASQGDPMARLAQSLCLARGVGTDENMKEAFRLARLAHDDGIPEAKCLLGYYFFEGIGVEINVDTGTELLTESLKTAPGLTRLFEVELAYLLGRKNNTEFEDLRNACVHAISVGVKTAVIRLVGTILKFSKQLSTENYERFVRDLTDLANGGNPHAQYMLANLLTRAVVVSKDGVRKTEPTDDERKAAHGWLIKAADQGYISAQGDLAVEYYAHPYFVTKLKLKKDVMEAQRWMNYAMRQDYPPARKVAAMMSLYDEIGDGDAKLRRQFYDAAVKSDRGDKLWRKFYNDELFRLHKIRYDE